MLRHRCGLLGVDAHPVADHLFGVVGAAFLDRALRESLDDLGLVDRHGDREFDRLADPAQ